MEILLVVLAIILGFCLLLDKATGFIKQLKNGSVKLKHGFRAEVSVVPIEQKSEVSASNTNSTDETIE